MSDLLGRCVVYEWQTPKNYMIHSLAPDAARFQADPLQTLDNLMAALPSNPSAAIFHINCTITENFPTCRHELVAALSSRCIPVLNSSAVDTGKRFLQKQLEFLGLPSTITRRNDGQPDDLVIVKTDYNYGSYGELKLSNVERDALGLPVIDCPITKSSEYQVLMRSKVPELWWHHPQLTIEDYIDNDLGRKYRVYFAGSHCFVVSSIDKNLLKKTRTQQSVSTVSTDFGEMARLCHNNLPSNLQRDVVRLIKHLRMDFGAIDLAQNEQGTCFIIDINTTSYWRPYYDHAIHHLQDGLNKLIVPELSMPPINRFNTFSTVAAYVDSLAVRDTNRGNAESNDKKRRVSVVEPKSWRQKPPRNADSTISILPASSYDLAEDLCIIVSIFNADTKVSPKWFNYNLITSVLDASNIAWIGIEHSSQPFARGGHNKDNVLRIAGTCTLWQKERLLNEAIKRVPGKFTKIAWIDADILFDNASWAKSASQLLDDIPVVQLCQRVVRLPRGHHAYLGKGEVWETFGSVYERDPTAMDSGLFGFHGHTGFGWAARREVIEEHGLYDACVVGGADHFMAHAFCGDWDSECVTKIMGAGSAWHDHARRWAKAVYPSVRSRVGVVSGTALHLWHGSIESRSHGARYQMLREGGFDPIQDLRLSKEGIWQWGGSRTAMYNQIEEYMNMRGQECQ